MVWLHYVEIVLWLDAEDLEHLIEHLTVLPGYAYRTLGPGFALECLDYRRQLDGLRASAKDDGYFVHGGPIRMAEARRIVAARRQHIANLKAARSKRLKADPLLLICLLDPYRRQCATYSLGNGEREKGGSHEVGCPKCPAEVDIGPNCDDVSDISWKLYCAKIIKLLAQVDQRKS